MSAAKKKSAKSVKDEAIKRFNDVSLVTAQVAALFPSFGGGKTSSWNPISAALKDQPACFAAGVDIKQVVEFVMAQADSLHAQTP